MATTRTSSNVPSTSNTSGKTPIIANSMMSTTATSSELPQIVDVIPQQTIKNLSDKRKQAGEEIEALVKKFVANKEKENIKLLILQILKLTNSIQQPQRKAGLWALSAVSVGLIKDIKEYFPDLLPIILQAVKDSDPKIRFHACEALYNLCKAGRNVTLSYFPDIFESLTKLCSDNDNSVKNASLLVNRLLKDIVNDENSDFVRQLVVPILQKYVTSTEPYLRQLIVGWIVLLDSIPEVHLMEALPGLLSGLMDMLTDSNKEIVTQVSSILDEFLAEFESHISTVDFGAFAKVIIDISNGNSNITSAADNKNVGITTSLDYQQLQQRPLVKHYCLEWIQQLLVCGDDKLLPFANDFVAIVVPCLSYKLENIRVQASNIDKKLLKMFSNTKSSSPSASIGVDQQKPSGSLGKLLDTTESSTDGVQPQIQKQIEGLIEILEGLLQENAYVPTKISLLCWFKMLLDKHFDIMMRHIDKHLSILLKILIDQNDEVVSLDLEVLALVSTTEVKFKKFISCLVDLFKSDTRILSKSGFIIRKLSVMLNPEKIFRELAKLLLQQQDKQLEFSNAIVQILCTVLLTSKELSQLRKVIKGIGLAQPSSLSNNKVVVEKGSDLKTAREFFLILFKCFSFNPASAVSLCLLSCDYKLSSEVIMTLGEGDIGVNTLVQFDNLIQLLESPIFCELRLQLLEPQKHPYLLKTLYGILMLLPQSGSYDKLSKRLESSSTLTILHNFTTAADGIPHGTLLEKDQTDLLEHFKRIQSIHRIKVSE